MAAQSHPGLLVLKRAINPKTGKLMTVLSVDEIRKLPDFFGMTSGAGGWRVAIVDTADDMNDNAANALLKMLEEPPGHAMLLLLSSTPGRLLPTIRSRCQRLDLRPLDGAVMEKALAQYLPETNAAERELLARLSGGSIGAALTLATGDGGALAEEADRLIDHAREPDLAGASGSWRQAVPDPGRAGIVRQFSGREPLGTHQSQGAHSGVPGLERWWRCCASVSSSASAAPTGSTEPRQTVLSAARDLSRVARGGAL